MKKYFLSLIFLTIAGCSSDGQLKVSDLLDNRPDYKRSSTVDHLEIPPNLSSKQISNSLALPTGYRTNSLPQNTAKKVSDSEIGLSQALKNIKKQGNLTWIEIDDSPENIFLQVQRFWKNAGLKLNRVEKNIGIIETDWLEKETNYPKSGISRLLKKLISNISDDGKRDRFRVRVDSDGKKTQVYVTHYGAKQTTYKKGKIARGRFATNDKELENTIAWSEDSRNRELETEMLRRLNVYLLQNKGTVLANNPSQSKNTVPNKTPKASLITLDDGTPAIIINSDYNKAWILLSIAIDRVGLDISSSQREKGAINVSEIITKEIGILFTEKETIINNYNIAIADQDDKQIIVVRSHNRSPASNQVAKTLLERIAKPLR